MLTYLPILPVGASAGCQEPRWSRV